jgi:threonine/homoserine/homoserine lactone efflux protein
MKNLEINFGVFLLQVVIISLSGVMAPGPVTAVTIGKGGRTPHAGAFIALGHGVVEAPLIFVLMAGAGLFFSYPVVKIIIGFSGGIMLLLMSIDMFRSVNAKIALKSESKRSPFIDGVFLSAGNPYLIIWWATVGMTLINGSAIFGLYGILMLILVHWLCDFTWLYILSAVSFHGGRLLGGCFSKVVFIICGIMLAVFGLKFIVDAAGVTAG